MTEAFKHVWHFQSYDYLLPAHFEMNTLHIKTQLNVIFHIKANFTDLPHQSLFTGLGVCYCMGGKSWIKPFVAPEGGCMEFVGWD